MLRPLSYLLVLVVVSCGSPASPPVDGLTTEQRFDAITQAIAPAVLVEGDAVETATLQELMARHSVPGVSVAVFYDGEIQWARGFGKADVEGDRPVTPETLFQAASISKPVAAAAALTMVDEGLLKLDEDINEKLTSWKVPGNPFTEKQPVTVRDLITHTAGMTVHGFPGYAQGTEAPGTVGVLDGHGNTDPIRVDTEPGTLWRYSGGGYTVLQQLLEDVAGESFPDIVQERVHEPAGMSLSTYQQPLPQDRHGGEAFAYQSDGSPVEGKWHTYPEMAAAGLWTTPSDLARFAMAIQRSRSGEGHLLEQKTAEEMLTPGLGDWGLGPSIEGNGKRFGHGGANAGYRCSFTASIDEGWGIVVMTNGDQGGQVATPLMIAIAASYGWDGPPAQVRSISDVSQEALGRVAGKYQMQGDLILDFEARDRRLYVDVPNQGLLQFLPQSETEFVQLDDGRIITFIVDDGRVTGFTSPGIRATRVP